MLDLIPATRFEDTVNLDMHFPPLPGTILVVTKLLNEPGDTPDMLRLVDAVHSDPIAAASVLRRINSTYEGLRRRISDIRKAAYLLGFLDVSNMILCDGMMRLRSIINSEEQVRIYEHIIKLSIGAAAFSQDLANHLSLSRKSTIYTASMLHILGRLVLLYNRPFDYEALWLTNENDDKTGPSIHSENIIFGTDHIRLGAMISDRWQLPEDIVSIIEHCRTPEKQNDHQLKILTLTVAVGIAAAEQFCFADPSTKSFNPPKSLTLLADLSQEPVPSLVNIIEKQKKNVLALIQRITGF